MLRTIGGGRAGEIGAARFLDHDDVTVPAILATAAARTLAAAKGQYVLAVHDTTEVNFKDRAARRTGLGPAGDGVSPGFFCHPLLLVDAEHEAVLGLVHADIWTRDEAPVGDRAKRAIADKESARWLAATRPAPASRMSQRRWSRSLIARPTSTSTSRPGQRTWR